MTENRLAKLRAALKEQDWDGILVTHGPNRRYMTGFSGSAGHALVTEDEALLFVDYRYEAQAAAQAPSFAIVKHGHAVYAAAAEEARRRGLRRIAFEGKHLTVAGASQLRDAFGPDAELIPSEEAVERLRDVKDADEIGKLERAVRIAEQAFVQLLEGGFVRAGVSERRAAAELEYRMRLLGADCGWHPFIVASGVRSALPHGSASDKEIAECEFVTFDFGAIVDGYMSDITRTVFVGTPSERHREIYEAVLAANRAAVAGLRPGLTGKEGDALGRDAIAERGFGDFFGHGLGHGIGLEIHESVRLSPQSETVLEAGNVLTVEPGVYIPGLGGVRIEDDVLITETGVRALTSLPKELLTL